MLEARRATTARTTHRTDCSPARVRRRRCSTRSSSSTSTATSTSSWRRCSTSWPRRAPWVRPADTGRSTNCLVNAAGIHTHLTEQGYHNYADALRVGRAARPQDAQRGDGRARRRARRRRRDPDARRSRVRADDHVPLTAWYESVDDRELRPGGTPPPFRRRLPAPAIPSAFVARRAAPHTERQGRSVVVAGADRVHRPPPGSSRRRPPTERIAEIWAQILGSKRSGSRTTSSIWVELRSMRSRPWRPSTHSSVRISRDASVFRVPYRPGAGGARRAGPGRCDRSRADPIAPLDPGAPLPLAEGEEAMLFEYRMAPDDPRYNVTRLYRCRRGGRPTDRVRPVP